MRNKIFGYVLGLVSAIGITAYAAKNTDLIQIFGVSGSDSEIQMSGGDAIIDYDQGSSKLRFSNNGGADFKNIGAGAGGGGGINLLSDDNADFESGTPPSSWTASGGTFSSETGSPLFDGQSGQWDSNGSSQTLASALKNVPVGLESNQCVARIYYSYEVGSSGDYKLQALDSSSNVLAEVDLDPTTGATREIYVVFTCPSSDQVRMRLESQVANADPITIDNAHLGSNIFAIDRDGAELVAHAYYPRTTNCNWQRTSTSVGAFPTDSDCPSISVISSGYTVDTSDDDLPNIVFGSLPPGRYVVEAAFTGQSGTAGANMSYAITDGTNTRGHVGVRDDNTSALPGIHALAAFEYTTAGARTFSIHGNASAGTVGILNTDGLDAITELKFTVRRYPLQSERALSFDQADWHIDASIGGATISLGSSAQSSYVAPDVSGLDLVVNPGSAPALIGCTTTEESSGLTCSANEQPSISFTIPYAGIYRACTAFSHTINNANGVVTFQITETGNASQTVIQEGKDRVASRIGSQAFSANHPYRLCGTFVFDSVGKKTLRLMYEQDVTSATANEITASRNASIGQPDIHWEVYPITQFKGGIRFDNMVSSTASEGRQLVSAFIDTSAGTPFVSRQDGNWIDSLDDNGVGNTTINFVSAVFSGTPNCVAVPVNDDAKSINVQGSSSSSVDVRTASTSTQALGDARFNIICVVE